MYQNLKRMHRANLLCLLRMRKRFAHKSTILHAFYARVGAAIPVASTVSIAPNRIDCPDGGGGDCFFKAQFLISCMLIQIIT